MAVRAASLRNIAKKKPEMGKSEKERNPPHIEAAAAAAAAAAASR